MTDSETRLVTGHGTSRGKNDLDRTDTIPPYISVSSFLPSATGPGSVTIMTRQKLAVVTTPDAVERRLRFPVDHPDLDVGFYTTVHKHAIQRHVGAAWTDPDGTAVTMECSWLSMLMDRLERTFPVPDARADDVGRPPSAG